MIDPWAKSYVEQFGGVCPMCRGAVHPAVDICPGCRQPWRLGLKVVEAYLVVWGVAVAALALESGLDLFLLLLILLGGRPSHMPILVGIGLLGVPAAAGMVVLLVMRRRFCALPRLAQWLTAWVAVLVLLGSGAGFMAFLR